jgi:hypothetical protein
MENMMDFMDLRYELMQSKIRQKTLVEESGLPGATLSLLINDKQKPYKHQLRKIQTAASKLLGKKIVLTVETNSHKSPRDQT